MSSPTFTTAIQEAIGEKIIIRLLWKIVSLARRGSIPMDERVQVLHVEVPYDYKEIETKVLLALYGRQKQEI